MEDSNRIFALFVTLFIILFAVITIYASDSDIQPQPASVQMQTDWIAENLLVNTPPLGVLPRHWDEYLASLNWADYQVLYREAEQPPVPTTCDIC